MHQANLWLALTLTSLLGLELLNLRWGLSTAQAAPDYLEKTIPAGQNQPALPEDNHHAFNAADQARQSVALQQRSLDYQKNILQHWPQAELSSQSQWVEYSEDWQSKRVVDFANNQIRISLEGKTETADNNFQALRERVAQQLQTLLATRIQEAAARDPLLSPEQQTALKNSNAEGLQPLVLSELFEQAKPTDAQIQEKAQQLLLNAYIRYQARLAATGLPKQLGSKATFVVPMPNNRLRTKAKRLKPLVGKHARETGLPEALLLSIIHTESHFNPMARSAIPAYGLMQVVPHTAGRDASRELYEKALLLSPVHLYNPQRNIEVGSTYFKLIYFRYLKQIKDPKNRLYCAIAAYNTGASNVAKAFTRRGNMSEAAPMINRLTPNQVLEQLYKRLPSRETREYLRKILARQPLYARL